jgi:ABC-2 type transport system ATP-binding protein
MKNEPSSPALSLRKVTKKYGVSRGVTDLTLDVQKGEVFGFLGPNGAGKSTTIHAILDLIRPDKGTITIFGLDHRTYAVELHRQIGYVAGDMETDPNLTGLQYLTYIAHLRGDLDHALRDTYIKRLGCEVDKKIKHLSRGNKQKIGLVAAFMHDPNLLILDEPTSGLDPLVQSEFNEIIKECKHRGKTVFISSHILSEVQSICDRVGFIREGKLINVQLLEELIRTAFKKVHVTFKDSTALQHLVQLPGAVHMKTQDHSVTFNYKGEATALLSWLAHKPIIDISIADADLESLFLHYYEAEESADA